MTTVLAGQKAPDFALPDLDGRTRVLREALRQGPVVLAFYKISCPVCQFGLPYLNRIKQGYADAGVTVWGISQDDAPDAREFCKEFEIDYPSLVDEEGYPVSNAYGLTNVPTVLLVAPGGDALVSFTGFDKAGMEKISAELARLLGRPAVTVFHPSDLVPDYKPG